MSWLNPKWTTIQGDEDRPVDAYGAIPAPDAATLLSLNDDTVQQCTEWKANTTAATPLKVYVSTKAGQPQPKSLTAPAVLKSLRPEFHTKAEEENLREVIDHQFVELLDHPCPELSRYDLIRLVSGHVSLVGNAYIRKVRDGNPTEASEDGEPVELRPLRPQFVDLAFNDKGQHVGYWYKEKNPPEFIKKADVLHFRHHDFANPFGKGRGWVRAAYERILLAKNETAYLASLYRNQARFDSLISVTGISKDEREVLQKELHAAFAEGGIKGPWVVEADTYDVKPLNWQPKDVLGTELYKWNKLQIVACAGLHPAIFDSTTSPLRGGEQDEATVLSIRRGVLPDMRMIEHTINQQLAPEFDSRLMVMFDNPIAADEAAQLAKNKDYLDRGVYTINEVRAQEGAKPHPWGNEPIKQQQGQQGGITGKCMEGTPRPGPCPDHGAHEADHDVQTTARSWAEKARQVPAALYAKAKVRVAETFSKLEARYGKPTAYAILGTGLIGVPIPVPGASLITAAPAIAVGEYLRRRARTKALNGDLTPEEVHQLGKEVMAELLRAWQEEIQPEG